MVTETPAFSKLVLHSSTMPVPSSPEVTKSTCLKPIAAASGPACSYAPAPSSDRGCLKNSFTGNSNIREVSTIKRNPFSPSKYQQCPQAQPCTAQPRIRGALLSMLYLPTPFSPAYRRLKLHTMKHEPAKPAYSR